jgi:hypothetical protein
MHAACCKSGAVYLYWLAMEAQAAIFEICPHAFCKGQTAHRAYQLKPAVQTTPQQFAHSAGSGRD